MCRRGLRAGAQKLSECVLPLPTSYWLSNGGLLAVERSVRSGNWQAWDQDNEKFSLIASQNVSSWERFTLVNCLTLGMSEYGCGRLMKPVCSKSCVIRNRECRSQPIANTLVNKTKKKQTQRQRGKDSGYKWDKESGERQYRGRGRKRVIMGLFEIICVKVFLN